MSSDKSNSYKENKPTKNSVHSVPSSGGELGTLTDLTKAGERLASLRGEITQSEFSERYGLHKNTLGRYERGERPMDFEFVVKLCYDKDISPSWLLFGMTPKRGFGSLKYLSDDMRQSEIERIAELTESDPTLVEKSLQIGTPKARASRAKYAQANDFVYLPLHRNVSVSAGNGSIVWDEHDIDHLAFQASFIRHELRANPASLRLVRVSGDSMERLLYSGDMVMVDTSITALQAEGMYVFRIDDSISVKWLNAMPGGVIRVASENAAKYPPYEIAKEQAEGHHFQIIGLVRWWAHTQR
jgi:phage repressor protein C with HTH and peptisase S24 domain